MLSEFGILILKARNSQVWCLELLGQVFGAAKV